MASVSNVTALVTHDALNLDEIVEHILKFLPMKELHRMARVSKKWMKLAGKIKASRRNIAWILYDNAEADGLEGQIGNYLEVLASQPSVALLFCSSVLHKKPVAINKGNGKRKSLLLTNYLKRVLPPSCCLLGLTADGVVGTSYDMSKIVELEDAAAASCLLLPKMHGLDICSFELTDDVMSRDWAGADPANTNGRGCRSSNGSRRLSSARVDAVTRLPSDKTVRLILLFLTDSENSSDQLFAEALVRRYGCTNIAVAGGYGYDVVTGEARSRNRDTSTSGLGIAFCGDDCLQVASVVVHAEVSDLEDVKKCLQRLRVPGRIPPHGGNSVGFMFACIGRGEAFYDGTPNVESRTFSQLYPGVPLFGFFGGGEVGFDFPPQLSADIEDSTRHVPPLFHSYSSIFVMLTFS